MVEEVTARNGKWYRVIITREGDSWLADVPELEGTHTWGKNLISLVKSIREAIVLAEDLPDDAADTLHLDVEYRTGDSDLDTRAAELRCERQRHSAVEQRLLARTLELARDIERHGLSVRDAAALLGVSPQRVAQIAPRRERSPQQAKARR